MTPDHTPETDLERLLHQTFSDAEEQPPASVWSNIERNLATVARRRHVRTAAILSTTLLVAAAALLLLVLPTHSDTTVTQVLPSPADTFANTLPATTTPTQASTAATPHNRTAQNNMPVPKTLPPATYTTATPSAAIPTLTPTPTPEPQSPSPMLRADSLNMAIITLDTTPAVSPDTLDTTPRRASQSRPSQPQWLIPNVITPNGDGINDCFVIQGLENYAPVQVVIYTANSRRIFISDDYRNDFCGEGMPAGNYFYVLTIKEGPSAGFVRRGTLVVKDR